MKGSLPDALRSQAQQLLLRLHRANLSDFRGYMRRFVAYRPLAEVMDFFHAYMGFCTEPAGSSLLSPSKILFQNPLII